MAQGTGWSRRDGLIVAVVGLAMAVVVLAILLVVSLRSQGAALEAPVPAPTTSTSAGPDQGSDATSAPSNDGSVSVVLTFVELNEQGTGVDASGYISGVVESGGTCTLTLTRGSAERSAQSSAMPDAQSTQCGLLTIDVAGLTSGEWTASLSYEKDSVITTSSTSTVTVP